MDDWMILQAQMHQGQSHFATVATRPQDVEVTERGSSEVQQQQQPWSDPSHERRG